MPANVELVGNALALPTALGVSVWGSTVTVVTVYCTGNGHSRHTQQQGKAHGLLLYVMLCFAMGCVPVLVLVLCGVCCVSAVLAVLFCCCLCSRRESLIRIQAQHMIHGAVEGSCQQNKKLDRAATKHAPRHPRCRLGRGLSHHRR